MPSPVQTSATSAASAPAPWVAAFARTRGTHTLSEIRQALSTSDTALLRRAAQTLKGSAAILGAQEVVDAAFRLEMMGRENNLAPAAAAFERLESRTARLLDAVRVACDAKGSTPANGGDDFDCMTLADV